MRLEAIEKALLVWGPVSDEGITRIKQEGWLVVVPEGRPGMIGLRHNMIRLRRAGVKTVYCNDNVLGLLFYKKKIFKTFVFYKTKDEQGLTGFCGTLYAVLLSRLHQVTVEFLACPKPLPEFTGNAGVLGGKKYILNDEMRGLVEEASDERIEGEI